jgi:hypothetical protein
MKTRISCLVAVALAATLWTANQVSADDILQAMLAVYKPYEQTLEDQLRRAAGEGNVGSIKRLVARGAKIDALDHDGWSPLALAVAQYQTEAVETLLKLGAKTNPVSKTRHTPLGWAVIRGQSEIIELLLANGANIEAKDEKGWTPLMEASARGYSEVVELLISKGANANARNPFGATGLNLSSLYQRRDVTKLLLAKGADTTVKLHRVTIAQGVTLPVSSVERDPTALAQAQFDGLHTFTEQQPTARIALMTVPALNQPQALAVTQAPFPIRAECVSAHFPTHQFIGVAQPNGISQTDRRRADALALLREGLSVWNRLNTEHPDIARRLQELARNSPSLDVIAREMRKGF